MHCRHPPVRFAWRHQCGGVARSNFIVSSRVVREGVSPEDADVATDGIVAPGWAQTRFVADAQQE